MPAIQIPREPGKSLSYKIRAWKRLFLNDYQEDFKMPLTIGWAAEMFQAWKDSGGCEDAYLNFTNLGNGVWAIQDYTE